MREAAADYQARFGVPHLVVASAGISVGTSIEHPEDNADSASDRAQSKRFDQKLSSDDHAKMWNWVDYADVAINEEEWNDAPRNVSMPGMSGISVGNSSAWSVSAIPESSVYTFGCFRIITMHSRCQGWPMCAITIFNRGKA